MTKTLGLAFVAKKVTIGAEMTVEAVRKKTVFVVLLASDASKNTQKLVIDKTKFYGIEVIDELDSATISKAIGKNQIKVLGITDRGFSQLLINQKRK